MNYITANPRFEADGRCFVQGFFRRCKNNAETVADKRPVCYKHYQQWHYTVPFIPQIARFESTEATVTVTATPSYIVRNNQGV